MTLLEKVAAHAKAQTSGETYIGIPVSIENLRKIKALAVETMNQFKSEHPEFLALTSNQLRKIYESRGFTDMEELYVATSFFYFA